MSEPIDFYGIAWPRPEPAREELAELRAELRAELEETAARWIAVAQTDADLELRAELEETAARWIAVAQTDADLLNNPAFTECQRERLRGAGSALRRCARELREVIRGRNENLG